MSTFIRNSPLLPLFFNQVSSWLLGSHQLIIQPLLFMSPRTAFPASIHHPVF